MDDFVQRIKTAGDWISKHAEEIGEGPVGCTGVEVSFDVQASDFGDCIPEIEVTKRYYNTEFARLRYGIDIEKEANKEESEGS